MLIKLFNLCFIYVYILYLCLYSLFILFFTGKYCNTYRTAWLINIIKIRGKILASSVALFLLAMLAEVQSLRYIYTYTEYEPGVGENFGKNLTFVQFNINCKAFVFFGSRVWLLLDAFFLKSFKQEWNQFHADCSQMHQNRCYLRPFLSLTSLLRAPMSACLFRTTLNSPIYQGRLEKNLHYFREPYT